MLRLPPGTRTVARAHEPRVRSGGFDRLAPAALLALSLHVALLFGWHVHRQTATLAVVDREGMQFSFLEPDAAMPAAPALMNAPAPEPPLPEPVPAIVPVPKSIGTVRPETPPTAPVRKPAANLHASPKPVRPTPRGRPGNPPNGMAPGAGGSGTARVAASGTGGGKVNSKPVYSVRPSPIYPPESRAAHEEGVVILRLTVNAEGRPTAVAVSRSSGFPKLDRAAVEAGWRCRLSNAGSDMQFEAPIRFDLRAGPH